MIRDNKPFRALPHATLQWIDEETPQSADYGDVYYARGAGDNESRYTFLAGNDLPERFSGAADHPICIGETGFGTGLNFLLTWQAWRHSAEPKRPLHFVSIEHRPLRAHDITRALRAWPDLAQLALQLVDSYPQPLQGCHRLVFEAGLVHLDLHFGDAAEILAEMTSMQRRYIDAWYLDGFAPAKNPELWKEDVIRHIGLLSRSGASLATFTAASTVRHALTAAGFSVHKVAGFGSKREALRGRMTTPPAFPRPTATPWDIASQSQERPQQAIVLGAGLAGCWVASALAHRGVKVSVLEQSETASGGSGNAQGVLYTRLSHKHSLLTDFSLLSFLFASARYQQLLTNDALREGVDGALCGNLQLVADLRPEVDLVAALTDLPDLAQIITASQAAALTGVDVSAGGYWYPKSGWMNPPAVCRALLQHPNITLSSHCGPLSLHYKAQQWHAKPENGEALASAPCAVIATGTLSTNLAQLNWLPLRSIRGQTTLLTANTATKNLRSALCHEGYIAPAVDGEHCIGASFELSWDDLSPSASEHADNLAKLCRALPQFAQLQPSLNFDALQGRVGLRCTSPDYLPAVGPVPDQSAFVHTYSSLSHNARQTIDCAGDYLPGLYLSTAHGSRGLTTTPIAGELLASIICAEPLPMERSLVRALAPARYIVRDLRRKQG